MCSEFELEVLVVWGRVNGRDPALACGCGVTP